MRHPTIAAALPARLPTRPRPRALAWVCAPILALALAAQAQAALELKGWLEWVHEVQMRVVESGVVEQVAVSAGQHVKKGALLLRMDQREARANLLQARARVARARVEAEDAGRELGRARELFDRGLIAMEELKDAELKEVAVNAESEAAKALEEAAAVALERTELRAPFDGIVVARNAFDGAVIYKTLQQEPLIVVAPDDRMLARALVTANVLRLFQPGQRVKVRVNGSLRDAAVYSLGVQSVRVEREGAVYYLDSIFERRGNEILRPAETVQIFVP
jgi:RND family efflux transporter MFP subunit